jgi:hypothetical protein
VQQSLEETLGSRTIPSVLHQDVQHLTVLVYYAPKVVRYTSDTNEHFIQVPRVSGLRPPLAQSPGKVDADFRHQSRTLSWGTTTPRSAKINSTSRRLRLKK